MDISILTFNIHKAVGWVDRRSTLNDILANLTELKPDIVFLQEVRGSQFDIFSTGFWPHVSYGQNATYTKGHHGNAILSSFPIIFSTNINLSMHRYEQRGLLHTIVALNKDNRYLHLLNLHLGLFKNDRVKQLDKTIAYIKSTIPKNELLILGGDFNDWNKYASKPLREQLGLREAFLSRHGTYARTYPAWAPVFKLDRLYVKDFEITRAHKLSKAPWNFFSDHLALEVNLKINK